MLAQIQMHQCIKLNDKEQSLYIKQITTRKIQATIREEFHCIKRSSEESNAVITKVTNTVYPNYTNDGMKEHIQRVRNNKRYINVFRCSALLLKSIINLMEKNLDFHRGDYSRFVLYNILKYSA